MEKRIAVGAGAGLLGGLVLDMLMRVLPASTAEGSYISMITFAARAIHAEAAWAGWLAYPAYAIVLGALFGLTIRARTRNDGPSTVLGGVWGLGWSIFAGLALIPALLGIAPFSLAALQQARAIAVPLVVGHVGYGLVLGATYSNMMRALNKPGKPGSTIIRKAA